MRLGFSSAFATSDGRDPVPLQAPTKADSSETAGADSTPGAHIPCLGTLGPIDESVVNVKVSTEKVGRTETRERLQGNHSAKYTGKGFRELRTNTKRRGEQKEIDYMRGGAVSI